MLRLTIGSNYQLHSWFTYSMLLLFLSTAGFWVMVWSASWIVVQYFLTCYMSNLVFLTYQMARLNEGLSLFDAILIVPMFQIAWTFFSICTGFVYFQEYQVSVYLRNYLLHTTHHIGCSIHCPVLRSPSYFIHSI